ncbi:Fis-type helix-turn-helix domain protein [Halalkalibacter wakoensis JCM 9140]|uniref:Fis-type helix-turn-helix domain protein n=1 Tax=Halalkalibacter wakoensis JCM 9140 TaxID=1236970 RepID=W4PXU9_9BACI|nr:Fis-type helix-turn-helix domain protein [Halalkalibacter wakoensis JCM 9140]
MLFEGNDIRDDDQLNENLRFIHFQLKEELQEWDTFTDVLKSFFPAKTIVIWENPFSGVFIDLEPKMTDTVEHLFESIVDTVASDFFVEISLYIGIGNVALTEAKSRYQLERETFQIVKQLVNKPIYKGEEELPFLLIGEAPPVTLQKFTDQTLSQIIEERELIHSIKVYLDCNMNISHAAKKLFLHRNTMQYRVDKFIEKTGIDIRHFRSAVSIYLALLIERNIH